MKATFAKQHSPVATLEEVVTMLKPTALIGKVLNKFYSNFSFIFYKLLSVSFIFRWQHKLHSKSE